MQRLSSSLSIFTDGSKIANLASCVFYVPVLKYSKAYRLSDNTSIYMAEMVAILESLQFVLTKPPMSVVIYSDSLSSVNSKDSGEGSTPIHQEIRYCLYQLWCLGVPVTICWIPSHVGILGNEVADRLAKEALLSRLTSFPILKTVNELNSVLQCDMITQWQAQWECSKKARFYFKIQPTVSENVKYTDKNKMKQTSITRLRFGKCLLADVLHLLGRQQNDRCEYCHAREDVHHFLMDCMRYTDSQVERNDSMLESGVTPSIEEILGNPRWYEILWNYILKSERSL